jgi:hypothetical protein
MRKAIIRKAFVLVNGLKLGGSLNISKSIHAAAVAAFLIFAMAGAAQANSFTFISVGSCSEACSATAVITTGAGTLSVVLTDTQSNPRSAGDLVSSIEIIPSGGVGTPTLASQSGQLITVTSTTGPYTTSPGPPTHWGVGVSSNQIVLETAGPFAQPAQPINMIIGPPDASGNYSNANASITNGNFSPYINGTGTFVINDSAITASTNITGVFFNFGTGPDTVLPGVSVPEPNSLLLLGFAFITTAAFYQWRKSKASKSL